jgi:glycosyltransferase involved in cell wall biosynthesis
MNRYAVLLQTALESVAGIECRRVSVSPTSQSLLNPPPRLRTAISHLMIAWNARYLVRKNPADIYHIVDGSHGYIARSLPRDKTVITAHDIIPQLQVCGRFPVSPPGYVARRIIQISLRSVGECAQVIAVSQSTRNDLCEIGKIAAERLNVVPSAVLPDLLPSQDEHLPSWKQRKDSDRPFLLHIGNDSFYKNRRGVVRIFDQVRHHVPLRLVLAGPPPDAALQNLIRTLQLQASVDFVTSPDDATIMSLYRNARLLLFPSIYEGFGWPPLEAMAWRCPVVCSSNGSLCEVVGRAALTADAKDEDQLAKHCLSILNNPSASDQLVSLGVSRVAEFSVARFREGLLDVYKKVCSTNGDITRETGSRSV